jgi:hypothetical protein
VCDRKRCVRHVKSFEEAMKPRSKFLLTAGPASLVLALCAFAAGGHSNAAATSLLRSARREGPQRALDESISQAGSGSPIDEHRIHNALCSVVYQVDRAPGSRGYRYIFYGNAFFINEDGYALTVAHVLSQLRGVQPALLLRSPEAGPHFVAAEVVAIDREHEVAILRATPNPFIPGGALAYLPLDSSPELPGHKVLSAALRPIKPRDAWTLDPAMEERSAGDVLRFETSKLAKGVAASELFLFNHAVELGQSGAPVLAMDSGGVAGLVEGRWLRGDIAPLIPHGEPESSTDSLEKVDPIAIPGAAVPIRYAIALLEQKGITWRPAPQAANKAP